MTIITHILVTTVGVQALHLTGKERILAYVFGCAVDIDHVIKAPYYYRAIGLKDKRGYYWRSSLQEPVALLWVIPLSILLRTYVPVLFLAIHMALDYSVRYEKMPFFPYSWWITRGWLTGISDKAKEVATLLAAVALNVWLWLPPAR